MNFVEAMTAAQSGYDAWAAKPHNAKWAKMIYHTPIPNDLLVNIATEVAAASRSADAKADGWDAIADDVEALQVFAQGRALGGGRLIPWAINTIKAAEAALSPPDTVRRNFANEFHRDISIEVEATEWGYGAVITMVGPESTATNVVTNKEAEELHVALGDFLKSLASPPPVAEGEAQPVAWCQPMDCGKHTSRKFLLRFDDADKGDCVFDDEAEAREFFERANGNWNCYLFGALPLFASPRPEGGGV